MNRSQNQQLVEQFFEAFSAAQIPAALTLLEAQAVWQVMGREGGPPMSNTMDKQEIGSLIQMVADIFPKGLNFRYLGWTIEGNRVALEMESYGVKANGTVYNNAYHFLVKCVDGKITELKEYMDTLHVKAVFIDDSLPSNHPN